MRQAASRILNLFAYADCLIAGRHPAACLATRMAPKRICSGESSPQTLFLPNLVTLAT